jgi:hypothetical protein
VGGLHVKHAVQRGILGTNSAFALGPRNTTGNLDRVGRSQDLPDAKWLWSSSPALNTRALTLVPICAVALFQRAVYIFLLLFFVDNFGWAAYSWRARPPYLYPPRNIVAQKTRSLSSDERPLLLHIHCRRICLPLCIATVATGTTENTAPVLLVAYVFPSNGYMRDNIVLSRIHIKGPPLDWPVVFGLQYSDTILLNCSLKTSKCLFWRKQRFQIFINLLTLRNKC